MAKSTTFKGVPKPFGASGWYFENRRHMMAARGLRTGINYVTMTSPLTPNGTVMVAETVKFKGTKPLGVVKVQYLKGKALKDSDGDGVPDRFDCEPGNPNKQDLAETWQHGKETAGRAAKATAGFVKKEAAAVGEFIKKEAPIVKEKAIQLEHGIEEGIREIQEANAKATLRRRAERKLEEQEILGIELEEQAETSAELEGIESMDTEAAETARLESYSDKHLELLAVRTKGQINWFTGETENPYKEELLRRMREEQQLAIDKVKLKAQLEPITKQAAKEIREIKRENAENESLSDILFGGM